MENTVNCEGCGASRIPAALVHDGKCPVCGARFEQQREPTPDREMVAGEVIGWRAWEVHRLGKLLRLGSVSHNAHWPIADYVYAECNGKRECYSSSDGRVPGEECSCGLYAARDFDHLTKGLPYADYSYGNGGAGDNIKIIGEVAMSGKVIVGTQGWKAEKARVAKLYVPHTHWKLGRDIAAQYGVPYETLRWIG